MHVAVYYNNQDVRLKEMPVPEIGAGEVLVKVMACGICGSDVMEWYRIKRAPLVLGHEITGVIDKVGENVKNYKVGDRAFVSHHVPCNTCRYCLADHHTACETLHTTNVDPGGFAEYIRVPPINVDRGIYQLPDSISFEDGTLIEPLACVVRGQRLAKVQKGNTVLVIGSGVSGLLHIQLARTNGAERIIATDISKYRMDAAKQFGADATIHAKEYTPDLLKDANEDRLADRVIVCTGATSAFEQALQSVDRGGTVVFFAPTGPDVKLSISVADLWRNEVTLMTSYGAGPPDIPPAIELIQKGGVNVHDMITHQLPLEEVGLGFKLAAEAKECIKVVIRPSTA